MQAWIKTSLAALLAGAALAGVVPTAGAQERDPTPEERAVLERADVALKAKDYAKLRAILAEPALANFARAHKVLGQLHAQGLGGPKDPVAARAEYRRAAELGDYMTMVSLAEELEREGTPASRSEARSWFTASITVASDSGYPTLANHPRAHLGRMAWNDGDFAGAVNQWSRAGGDPFASACLGAAYALGKGTAADPLLANYAFYQAAGRGPNEGIPCMEWAAQAGNVYAQYALALIYGDAQSKAYDAAKSIAYYRSAADAGHLRSAQDLAEIYDEGKGVARDPAAAYRYYGLVASNPASNDYTREAASARMGEMAFAGDGVAKNVAEAVRLMSKAEYGNHNYQLGLIYAGAGGYPVDMDKAVEAMGRVFDEKKAEARAWLKQQADAGNAKAQYAYASETQYDNAPDEDANGRELTYEQQEAIEKKIYDQAWRYYRSAARQNLLEAMFKLASDDSELPDAERLRLMRAAVDRGYVPAMLEMARWNFLGWHGFARSEANERAWLDRAAATGDPRALASAGETYVLRGAIGTNYMGSDPAKIAEVRAKYRLGMSFYERAHAAGYEGAAGVLADIYEREGGSLGLGNPQLAFKWRKLDVERSPDQKNRNKLSILYETGKGTPADPMRAWFWAKRAEDTSSIESLKRVATLWQRLTPAQQATAERAMITCELSNWQNCAI